MTAQRPADAGVQAAAAGGWVRPGAVLGADDLERCREIGRAGRGQVSGAAYRRAVALLAPQLGDGCTQARPGDGPAS